jgi:hypothetical protein
MGLFADIMARNQEWADAVASNDSEIINRVLAKYPELGYQAPTKVMSETEYAQSVPLLEPDGDGGMRYANNPSYGEYLNSLPDSLKNTPEYYSAKATDLTNNLFGAFRANNSVMAGGNNVGKWTEELEDIKKVNPAAYYNAALSLDLQKAGWDAGQGKTNDITNARIQSTLNDAIKSGAIAPEQYQNLVANNYAPVAQANAKRIASTDNSTFGQGALFVGGAMLGAYGIDSALAAAAAANAATATPNAYMAAAGLNPGTFEGAAFTMPELAGAGGYTSMNDYMSQAGLDAGKFNGFVNSDALNYANTAKKLYGAGSNIAKLLGGVGGAGGGASGSSGGANLSNLANAVRGQNTFVPIGLEQIQPKNPFFGSNQGTLSGEDIYDVSGSNLANALRKR